MRKKNDLALYRTKLVHKLCTIKEERKWKRYPKVMPILVTYDELVEKPHNVNEGVFWREECFACVLVPEGLTTKEVVSDCFLF